MSTRPAIPQAVIEWSDDDALPVGAGDPAVAIDGPRPFAVILDGATRRSRPSPVGLDAALFSVLVATLAGLVGAVWVASGQPNSEWTSLNAAVLDAAGGGTKATVEVSGLRIEAPLGRGAPETIVAAKAASAKTAAN